MPYTKYYIPFKTIKDSKLYIVNRKSSGGFTLVEALVVLVALLSVGSIIGAILFSSLRGVTKTNTLQAVRQNGNYAITQISKVLRNAKIYNGLSLDGIDYLANCQILPPIPTPTPVLTKYPYLKITTADNLEIVFFCNLLTKTILQNGSPLVPADSVSVTGCSFTCTQNNIGDTPNINIELTLSQAGAGIFAESAASASFDTSITIRNPQR